VKRKILTILVSMLLLFLIPSVIGDNVESNPDDEIVWMRGLLFCYKRFGNQYEGLAIHLVVWYNTSSGLQREVYWFERLENLNLISFRDSAYAGRMFEVGAGLFTFVFGFFMDGLEIAP